MSETPTGLSLLKRLQARELLGDFQIINSLSALKEQAVYKTMAFPDYIDRLQGEIHAIPEMALWAEVDLGNASQYLTELTRSYELALDGINRVTIDATCFLGRIRVIYTKAQSLKAPFQALWTIGAQDILAGSPLAKLSAKDLTALATMEFSTFLEESDLEWAAAIETVELILDNLKAMRKLAGEKYAMGKDQVNAALSEMDIPDQGLEGRPTATRQSRSAGVETLRGMFGDRVRQPEASAVPETDEDLPPDLRAPAVDLDALPPDPKPAYIIGEADPEITPVHVQAEDVAVLEGSELPGPGDPEFPGVCTAEDMAVLEGAFAEPEITPEASQVIEDIQVGDKVLVVGDDLPLEPGVHEVTLMVTPEDTATPLVKPKKGEALVIPFNLNVQAPGTLHVTDFLIGKGKTKFELSHQDNPEENGLYRFMGADAPLVRIEGEAKTSHPEPEHREVKVELPPQAQPQQTLTPDMEATILSDPFLGQAKAQEVVDTIKATQRPESDDLPPEEPAAEETQGDDLPPEGDDLPAESTGGGNFDEDDLPPEGPVVDKTPATQELAAGLTEEVPAAEEPALDEPVVAPAPPPEPPKPEVRIQVATSIQTTQAAAPSTSSAPKPGGLFRSRVVTPGTTPAPAFKASKPEGAPAVSTDDLSELM